MFDTTTQDRPAPPLQRAKGAGAVEMGAGGVERLYQSGSAKVILPRVHGVPPEAVLINTAGGMTGGDRFDWAATALPGARLAVTTQAAERAYKARGAQMAEVTVRLRAEAGAMLDWLPQETIMFDESRLSRRLEVDLAPDARALIVEPLIFGRHAMGEALTRGAFHDQWRIRRDGRLIHAEATRLQGDLARALARAGGGAGARAMATVLYLGADAQDRLEPLRRLLPTGPGLRIGASAMEGRLVLRALCDDAARLRKSLSEILTAFRGCPLPRVWQM